MAEKTHPTNKPTAIPLKFICLFGFAVLLLQGCQSKETPPPSFFSWKNTFDPTPAERAKIDSLNARPLYVKILDIGLSPENGQVTPLARTRLSDTTLLRQRGYVAAIFITNETFLTPDQHRSKLPEHIIEYLKTQLPVAPQGLLIDCDWTPRTREAFFDFLRKLDHLLPENIVLSATIRLHQYKAPDRTGVPPVDRGLLMVYNTGDIESMNTRSNSILNRDDAAVWIENTAAPYPLPLDWALPLFEWALVFREGEFWKIIRHLPENTLSDTMRFSLTAPPDDAVGCAVYTVKKSTFETGHFLRPGDIIRHERITPNLLQDLKPLLSRLRLADDAQLVFFDLEDAEHFPLAVLKGMSGSSRMPEK